MPDRGALAGLGLLAGHLRRLASVPARAARPVAARVTELLQEEYAEGADPYGRAWEPIVDATKESRSQTTEPPLTDHGTMRAGTKARPQRGAGVTIDVPDPGEAHQEGWHGPLSDGPARPILPNAGFPSRWRESIDAEIADEFERAK